jgi:hypothetical protein
MPSAFEEDTKGGMAVKRVRVVMAPKLQRERRWLEVLPLDPRDRQVVRAHEILRSRAKR